MLLGPSPSDTNGIDLGFTEGTVWFNASFGGAFDSIQYMVTELTLDYIMITDVPNGVALTGGTIPVGERVWGNCSQYNNSIGYMGVGNATWTVEGGSASRLSSTHGIFNGVDVGTTPGDVWFNISYGGFTYTVLFTVIPPSPDSIIIRDSPDNSGDLVGDGVYIVYQEEPFYAAGYNNTVGYIGDVDVSWVCDDTQIGNVDPQSGTSTTFTAQKVKVNGSCVVTASYLGLSDSTGILLVVVPAIDYVAIHDGPNGTGNLLDSMTFSLNEQATFYAAGYNVSGGFIEDLADANWEVENAIGDVTTPGAQTTFTALVYGTGVIKVSYTFDTTLITNSSGTITVEPTTDNTAPTVPIQPTLIITGDGKIEISWAPNTEPDLAGYKIYRRTSPDDDWDLIGTMDATTITYTDSNLKANTRYYYSITAFDDAPIPNESPNSLVSSVTTHPKSEAEDDSSIVPILLAIIVVVILLFLILLFKRKSKIEKIPAEGAAWGYGIDDKEKPPKPGEGKKEEKEPSEEEEPPPPDDEDLEPKVPEKEGDKQKAPTEDEEEPPPPDDEEEPPPPDDE
jgi:hypothetical protein